MKKHLYLIPVQLFLIAIVFIVGKTLLQKSPVAINTAVPQTRIKPTPTPTPDPQRAFSIVLLGFGGGLHDGGTLTDSILQVSINPRQKRVFMVSIPRDLYVPMPLNPDATVSAKINAAYPYGNDETQWKNRSDIYKGAKGGGNLAKAVLSQVTGIPADYYVAVSFDGFVKAIDSIGGIDVSIGYSFTDPRYPIDGKEKETCGMPDEQIKSLTATMSGDLLEEKFTCRYETLTFTKGKTHMDGETALKYARSRHAGENGGDFARGTRQREVLMAARDKVMSIGFLPKIFSFIKSLGNNIDTDITASDIQRFIGFAADYKSYSVYSTGLSDQNVLTAGYSAEGSYVLEPKTGPTDWNYIHSFVATALTSTASATVK
jgi:polyisoprenyl-teichoic acid--peptidoglycan teichoic acid transferase